MGKEKTKPPTAFVAGGLGKAASVDERNAERKAKARSAFAQVKANAKLERKRHGNEDRKKEKKEWWMVFQPPPAGSCIIKLSDETPWHSLAEEDSEVDEVRKLDKKAVESLTNRVASIFAEEVNKYEKTRKKSASSESKWMDDMIKAGTFSDKVAALALRVQESPVHQLDTLDALIHLADKSEQRAANTVLEAIKDLFTHNLLPDRHLMPFTQRQLGAKNLTMEKALIYYFEDQLLIRVHRVVNALEKGLKSTLEHFKKQCMEMVMAMLASKPEQEKRLLSLLVSKISDQTGNVTSKCIELLKSLMKKHPAMKRVVIREVHDLIFRDTASTRTVYSGIVFLSQVPLNDKERSVAALLVEGFIVIFEKAVSKEDMRARLMSALLTGINKAFPFLKDASALESHTGELFRIAHGDSFSSATQALTLLSHIALSDSAGKPSGQTESNLQTRFYRALYSRLLSDQILTRTRNTIFLNLLFRSIKRDTCDERCGAFVKRLAICATNSGANISAGLLLLISEVVKARPTLASMLMDTEVVENVTGDLSRERFGPYDASKREPKYAAPSLPSLWEASLMRHHAHPSVSKFADSLLQAPHAIKFAGDPTVDFTLSAFLNRFAFKNPKQRDSQKIRRALPTPEQPLNTVEFVNTSEADVDADKRFFHRFFGQRSRLRKEGQSRDRSSRKRDADLDLDLGMGVDDDEDAFGEPAMNSDGEDSDDAESGYSDADGDEEGDEDDEEAAMDRYADKLAEQLMRDHANGDDPDMDDFSSDEGDSSVDDDQDGDESDSEGDDVDFSEKRRGSKNATMGNTADSDSDSDDFQAPQAGESSNDSSDAEGDDHDDDNGDDVLSVDSEEGEFDEPIAKVQKRKGGSVESTHERGDKGRDKRARVASVESDSDGFASYSAQFESMMDEIVEDVKVREKMPKHDSSISSKQKNSKRKN